MDHADRDAAVAPTWSLHMAVSLHHSAAALSSHKLIPGRSAMSRVVSSSL